MRNLFNRARLKYLLFIFIAAFLIIITDPNVLGKFDFLPAGTVLAVLNITAFSFVGFIVTTIAPDIYMDKEYKERKNMADPGTILIARSIHTLGFCIIFATALFVFVS